MGSCGAISKGLLKYDILDDFSGMLGKALAIETFLKSS
jgi:hypothetical protein